MIAALWIVPLLLATASFPRWPWSRRWGHAPCIGLLLIGILVLWMHKDYII